MTLPDSTVSGKKKPVSDSTVRSVKSNVVSISEQRKKRASDSTVKNKSKKPREKGDTATRPKSVKGHEWRRQGTGWTLLRYWFEEQPDGTKKRVRQYVQHYSATALRLAETLRKGAL